MLNKMLQNLLNQIAEVIGLECGIADEAGFVLACTDEDRIGLSNPKVLDVLKSEEAIFELEDFLYKKIYIKNKLEFIIYIKSDSPDCRKYLSLISINIKSVKNFHDDKYDKLSFIKGLIGGDIPLKDIPLKAKDFHISGNIHRIVFLIRLNQSKDAYSYEVIQSLFPNKGKDFIIMLDDDSIVLVKELKNTSDYKEVEKTARIIVDTLITELMVSVCIGIGTIVDNLNDLVRSYNEAKTALTVGKLFDSDKNVLRYDNLGLGRLLYQTSSEACRLFLQEVFKDDCFEFVDAETAYTIQKFFENNLNISEASRQLYVHRNTLVYRLDKIQKSTGLDLRNFDDAVLFKVAMLVKKCLDSNKT